MKNSAPISNSTKILCNKIIRNCYHCKFCSGYEIRLMTDPPQPSPVPHFAFMLLGVYGLPTPTHNVPMLGTFSLTSN